MIDLRTYLVQRVTAIIMAPLVLIHIVVIIYAIQGGLTADEILGRTQGSLAWGLFYGAFVLTAGVHAGIGIRTVLFEWFSIRGSWLSVFSWIVAGSLVIFGLRAVLAVTMP